MQVVINTGFTVVVLAQNLVKMHLSSKAERLCKGYLMIAFVGGEWSSE